LLSSSSSNIFYFNDFKCTSITWQALCDSSPNTWDKFFTLGLIHWGLGNYWSDYNSNPGRSLGQYWINSPNDIDYYPLSHPWTPLMPLHGVAIANAAPSRTVFWRRVSDCINVTVINYGSYTETFNATVYANTTAIATQTVTLTVGNSTTITITWNTAYFAPGIYTISASVMLVQSETNYWAGPFTYGTVDVVLHFGGGGGGADLLQRGLPAMM
jgi:hypothetical protein